MSSQRIMWIATGLLFAVMIVAVALPVRPMVWIFPFWGAVVAAAMLGGVLLGVLAILNGWPTGGVTQ